MTIPAAFATLAVIIFAVLAIAEVILEEALNVESDEDEEQ